MAEFGPDIADQVIEVCKEGLGETKEALSRALDADLNLEIGEASSFDASNLDAGFQAAGLIFVMKVDDLSALFVVPESSGLLPDWYTEPDATGESKLATLAQELGMLMLPEEFMPLDFKAGHVAVITTSLEASELADDAHQVAMTLSSADKSTDAFLIWPAAQPDKIFETAAEETTEPEAEVEEPKPAEPTPEPAPQSPILNHRSANGDLNSLPVYGRSLLKIEVPVRVILANKKMSVDDITDIGIGSIIQFEKSCEETLNVEVGQQKVAEGEAIKVGDKFGLKVSSIQMPEERYISIKGRKRVM